MDRIDRTILNKIQISFPLGLYPYKLIGDEAGITEDEAFKRVEALRNKGIIRRIGGIFNSRRLGYVSTLCAARVPEAKIPVLADLIKGITEITHNYLRHHHKYNMWFTIIASSQEKLEDILAEIKTDLGSDEVYSLPATKVFKIGVLFDLNGQEAQFDGFDFQAEQEDYKKKQINDLYPTKREGFPTGVTEEDKMLIRLLQGNLPHSLTPFIDLAAKLDMNVENLLPGIQRLLDQGMMRRLGAILVHTKTGFTSNAMGVWRVPEEMVSETGAKMAEFIEVSHCYERPALQDWPYNIFTMIHGHSDNECKRIMAEISEATGIKDYAMLFSHKELKKSSMHYFTEKDEFINSVNMSIG